MIRLVCLGVLTAAALAAQGGAGTTLAALQQAADKKAAEWDALAKGLEGKIARLLPCDPKVRNAVDEVSQASQARMIALRQYMAAAADKAKIDAEATRRMVASLAALVAEMNTERAEAEQARGAIETQLAELGESARRRAALEEAQKTLSSIAAGARERAMQTQDQATRSEALAGLLRELDAAYQSRQKALESAIDALFREAARWNEYYAARIGRSLTECAITTAAIGPVPRPPSGKKQ